MASISDLAHAGLQRAIKIPTADALPEGRYVDLPGRGRVYVLDVAGPSPDAPVLVLLHALATTASLSWFPVLSDLAVHCRVIAFDQRWHGRGIRSKHFRLADCADDIAAVLDELGVEQCIPVGYSMGGAIAQVFWLRHRKRTRGLVLCATARTFRATRRERVFFPLVATAALPLAKHARLRVDRIATALPETPTLDPNDPEWGRAEFHSTSAWSLPEVLAELGRFSSVRWAGQIDVPTAVVVTARDHTVPTRRQRELAEAIPGAEVFEADGGHATLVLRAEEFRPALLAAVATVTKRAASRRVPRARRSG